MTFCRIGASLVLAAAVAAAALSAASAGPNRASSASRAKCPAHPHGYTGRRPGRTAETVLKAAHRQIPIAYRGFWVNSDGVVRLTPSAYDVTAVFALAAGEYGIPGPGKRYFREAARVCGRRVAGASWVVVFQVPESQSALYGTGTAFLAPTGTRHWLLWLAR